MSAPPAALELTGISKRFGAAVALSSVGFAVRSGTVHALLGENGAGKSTLMHIAFGTLQADAGTVARGGHAERFTGRPYAGVGMVHQHLSLVPSLTAVENFALGVPGPWRASEARARLAALGESSGLVVPPDERVRDLSVVLQQRLEILKALGRNASLLILDEPTAVLTPAEARDLLAWLRRFVSGGGAAVLVTHKLREALSIADEVTVLRSGRVTWSGRAAQATEQGLAEAVIPGGVVTGPPLTASRGGDVNVRASALTIAAVRGAPAIRGATFELRRGEVVGIAAVEGAGQRELLAALGGLRAPAAGTLTLPAHIAIIPADRRRDAILPEFSLVENVALKGLGRRRGLMPWGALRERTAALVSRFAIIAASPEARIGSLSGGNQQRLVVARELDGAADLVVADNPTRGLDISATAFVQEQLRGAAAAGATVVVHASDLDDVLAIADRVLVVHDGSVREVERDRELVGRAMLGAA